MLNKQFLFFIIIDCFSLRNDQWSGQKTKVWTFTVLKTLVWRSTWEQLRMTSGKKFYLRGPLESERKVSLRYEYEYGRILESDRDYIVRKKEWRIRIDSRQKAGVVGSGAFPYVFQHFKVVGQSIPFFIIFTAE